MDPAWIDIGPVRVDGHALRGLAHACRPARCGIARSCCARFEVCVGRREMRDLAGLVAPASRYCPALTDDDNPFDPLGGGLWALDTDERGLCVFAFRRGRAMLCSLHAAGAELGLPPWQSKPQSCWLWPLAQSPGPRPVLTVVDDAWAFPCNRPRPADAAGLDAGVAEILLGRFGRRWLDTLLNRL